MRRLTARREHDGFPERDQGGVIGNRAYNYWRQHRDAVRQALAAGKPVPAEVLAERATLLKWARVAMRAMTVARTRRTAKHRASRDSARKAGD